MEELKEEELIEKVGGRFKLSSLIQKRLVYLNKGGEPLVEYDKDENKLQVVVREILQDKIFLNMDDEAEENRIVPLRARF
ncbi:MAG: DNA-directed RNA polymerase subunit omega [Thermoguttaceae bacterium]|nr:DNA-directed RNA polymerase subunit omega [Thermoguttaceae bacterium]